MTAIKKQVAAIATNEVCCEAGISKLAFSSCKARYGGLEVSDVKKLQDVEVELKPV